MHITYLDPVHPLLSSLLVLSLLFLIALLLLVAFFPPAPTPSLPPTPSIPGRNYFALISNFVEERV
jgi:hypothetical protein